MIHRYGNVIPRYRHKYLGTGSETVTARCSNHRLRRGDHQMCLRRRPNRCLLRIEQHRRLIGLVRAQGSHPLVQNQHS